MSEKTWAEELAESEEHLQNVQLAARYFWMAYQEAINEVDAAEKQLMKLRVEGPSGEKEKT